MSRVIALAACGFTLAACTSSPNGNLASWPGLEIWKPAPPTAQLRIESQPPGADAKTSQGQTCRTPCEVTVQAQGEFTVTYALNGYEPQTVPVRAQSTGILPGGDDTGPAVRLDPNPVYAELLPTPPPKKRRLRRKRNPRVSATPKARPAQAAAPSPPPQQASQPALTPAAAYPWPPPPTR